MLAWHLPHQLAAELVLVGVSAAVLLYSLLPWGKNQWLRTHGVILCGYYAVGGLPTCSGRASSRSSSSSSSSSRPGRRRARQMEP